MKYWFRLNFFHYVRRKRKLHERNETSSVMREINCLGKRKQFSVRLQFKVQNAQSTNQNLMDIFILIKDYEKKNVF